MKLIGKAGREGTRNWNWKMEDSKIKIGLCDAIPLGLLRGRTLRKET